MAIRMRARMTTKLMARKKCKARLAKRRRWRKAMMTKTWMLLKTTTKRKQKAKVQATAKRKQDKLARSLMPHKRKAMTMTKTKVIESILTI